MACTGSCGLFSQQHLRLGHYSTLLMLSLHIEQAREGTRSAGPHKGNPLPRLDCEAEVGEYRCLEPRGVCKADPLQLQVPHHLVRPQPCIMMSFQSIVSCSAHQQQLPLAHDVRHVHSIGACACYRRLS